MIDRRSDAKPIVAPGPVPGLAWTLAWAVTGAAVYLSGVFNSPRTGPLWVALAGGMISWPIAGAFTFLGGRGAPSNRRNIAGLFIWAFAYLVSFGLVGFFAGALEDTMNGLIMMLIGWSIGPGAGAFASTRLLPDQSSLRRSGIVAGIWTLGFFAGSYIGLLGGYVGPELAKLFIGSFIGIPAALVLGFGLGSAAGGLIGSLIAVSLTRLVARLL